jgi:hypothetical protein
LKIAAFGVQPTGLRAKHSFIFLFVAYFPHFEKIKGGLRDHLVIYLLACYSLSAA